MEQPIRAAFTGRNTVNRPLRPNFKANSFEDNLGKSIDAIKPQPQQSTVPASSIPNDQTVDNELQAVLDTADHTQEHLDLALLKMNQNVEGEETVDLVQCVRHNADSLIANQASIDELKNRLKEQIIEEEKELAGTEGLEGTLLLEARIEQMRDRSELDQIHEAHREQCYGAQEAAENLRVKQQRQARLLGRLRWQQASLFTQLQELQSHHETIDTREKQMQEELMEDRTDIIVMKAQHEVHREHLAKQEVEMKRMEAEQFCSENFSAREIGRLSAELTALAAEITSLEENQGQQRDNLRGTEIVVDRLGEATQRASDCVDTLLEATCGLERGHDMITTLARQQDVVETQQRVSIMADLRVQLQQNGGTIHKLETQQDRASERLSKVRQQLWQLGDDVREAFEILKEQEDILNTERDRAQLRELSIGKSAGYAMCLLREFVVEVETMLEQSGHELSDLKRLCNVFQRQCNDLVAAMLEDNELIDNEIKNADDIIMNLNSQIEWFRMVSEKHHRKEEFERNSQRLRQQLGEELRQELLAAAQADEDLDEDEDEDDQPTVLEVVEVSPEGDEMTYRIIEATPGRALLDDDALVATVLSELRKSENAARRLQDDDDEDAARQGGYYMRAFVPEVYCSEEDLLSEESE